jgi:hypothetical protein
MNFETLWLTRMLLHPFYYWPVNKCFNCGPVASSAKYAVNMMFCGPVRDTVLTKRQTEKLNFDTNYTTIIVSIYSEGR